MSLVAHLTELRNRVAKALSAVVAAGVVAFFWYQHGLGAFVRSPYCDLPAGLHYGGGKAGCGLLVTDVFGGGALPPESGLRRFWRHRGGHWCPGGGSSAPETRLLSPLPFATATTACPHAVGAK